MRNVIVSLAALVVAASAAQAQTPTATASAKTESSTQVTAAPKPASSFATTGQVDFGLRGTDITGDAARFQRYRDLGDGGVLERFRFNSDSGSLLFEAGADNVGRSDQRFWGEFLKVGKLRASFYYDQVPLLYSNDARTPYTVESTGVFRMDPATRALLATNKTTRKVAAPALLRPVDLESRRDTLAFAMSASPTREVDLTVSFNSFTRDGAMPSIASFGFSNSVELPVPIDNRTDDLSMKAEWSNRKALVRVGYDGSWFTNDIKSIMWDNPLAVTDRVYPSAYADGRGPSVSRLATAPDSTRHMVSTAASYKLPGRSRITGYFGVGSVKSDAEILPYTTNTAAPVLSLARANVDGDVRIVSSNFTFTSRPNQYVWLNARYRYYDFDNRTEEFHSPQWILFDGVHRTDPLTSEPHSVKRDYLDLDASFTPFPFGALKVGYGRYTGDRTFRIFEKTVDNVFRTSFDVTGNEYFSVRALYEHPVSFLGFNGSVAAGKDDYKDTEFGLRDNTNKVYSVGANVAPNDHVAVDVTYTYENYAALQLSRTASPLPNPQFTDPTRNWSDDSDDTTKTLSASVDLIQVLPRTDLRFGWDQSKGKATYVYSTIAGSAVPTPVPLPAVTNDLLRGTIDLRYLVSKRLSLGVVYWYDEYQVEDFALGADTITAQADLPTSLLLGYVYRPYKAHTGMARVSVLW
ncbi:MAG: MtrB/PioB family outer membrane beta-barrel protein [Acidobacteria bacterium]|nr:MtrB/PioB family outer membrane beta-barrel protein [Acidobacteriota bacterium]